MYPLPASTGMARRLVRRLRLLTDTRSAVGGMGCAIFAAGMDDWRYRCWRAIDGCGGPKRGMGRRLNTAERHHDRAWGWLRRPRIPLNVTMTGLRR